MGEIFLILKNAVGNLNFHKAVVTDTNKNWTSAQLFVEVDREYREIKRRQRRGGLLR